MLKVYKDLLEVIKDQKLLNYIDIANKKSGNKTLNILSEYNEGELKAFLNSINKSGLNLVGDWGAKGVHCLALEMTSDTILYISPKAFETKNIEHLDCLLKPLAKIAENDDFNVYLFPKINTQEKITAKHIKNLMVDARRQGFIFFDINYDNIKILNGVPIIIDRNAALHIDELERVEPAISEAQYDKLTRISLFGCMLNGFYKGYGDLISEFKKDLAYEKLRKIDDIIDRYLEEGIRSLSHEYIPILKEFSLNALLECPKTNNDYLKAQEDFIKENVNLTKISQPDYEKLSSRVKNFSETTIGILKDAGMNSNQMLDILQHNTTQHPQPDGLCEMLKKSLVIVKSSEVKV